MTKVIICPRCNNENEVYCIYKEIVSGICRPFIAMCGPSQAKGIDFGDFEDEDGEQFTIISWHCHACKFEGIEEDFIRVYPDGDFYVEGWDLV